MQREGGTSGQRRRENQGAEIRRHPERTENGKTGNKQTKGAVSLLFKAVGTETSRMPGPAVSKLLEALSLELEYPNTLNGWNIREQALIWRSAFPPVGGG